MSTISSLLLAVVVMHLKYSVVENSLWEMNHKKTALSIGTIVAGEQWLQKHSLSLQQAFAYQHHNHNNSNSIKVSQDITQANVCSNSACINGVSNSTDIHR